MQSNFDPEAVLLPEDENSKFPYIMEMIGPGATDMLIFRRPASAFTLTC